MHALIALIGTSIFKVIDLLDDDPVLGSFLTGKSKSKTPQAAAPKAKTSRGMSGIEGATRSGALRDESPPGTLMGMVLK